MLVKGALVDVAVFENINFKHFIVRQFWKSFYQIAFCQITMALIDD